MVNFNLSDAFLDTSFKDEDIYDSRRSHLKMKTYMTADKVIFLLDVTHITVFSVNLGTFLFSFSKNQPNKHFWCDVDSVSSVDFSDSLINLVSRPQI